MGIDTDTIDSKLIKLFAGPEEEPLSGQVQFDDNTFVVFSGVKRQDLLYIKEYIEAMRVTDIEIQKYDGGPKDLQ